MGGTTSLHRHFLFAMSTQSNFLPIPSACNLVHIKELVGLLGSQLFAQCKTSGIIWNEFNEYIEYWNQQTRLH